MEASNISTTIIANIASMPISHFIGDVIVPTRLSAEMKIEQNFLYPTVIDMRKLKRSAQ